MAGALPKSTIFQKFQEWRVWLLALLFGVSYLLLAVGGWLTAMGMGEWYESLRLPPWQPPSWAFPVAWTSIVSLLAVATWLALLKAHNPMVVLVLYGLQLVLNVGWSFLFFAQQLPALALAEILVFVVLMLVMVITYWRVNVWAGLLLVPYLAWLILATAINWWIVIHN